MKNEKLYLFLILLFICPSWWCGQNFFFPSNSQMFIKSNSIYPSIKGEFSSGLALLDDEGQIIVGLYRNPPTEDEVQKIIATGDFFAVGVRPYDVRVRFEQKQYAWVNSLEYGFLDPPNPELPSHYQYSYKRDGLNYWRGSITSFIGNRAIGSRISFQVEKDQSYTLASRFEDWKIQSSAVIIAKKQFEVFGDKNVDSCHVTESLERLDFLYNTNLFSELPREQQLFFATRDVLHTADNGGLESLLYNSGGEHFNTAVIGLQTFGAYQTADILIKVRSLFPNADIPKNHEMRNNALLSLPDDKARLLTLLNKPFFKMRDKEEVEKLIFLYVRAHKEIFLPLLNYRYKDERQESGHS